MESQDLTQVTYGTQEEGAALQGTAEGRKRQRTEERQQQGDLQSGTGVLGSGDGSGGALLPAAQSLPASLETAVVKQQALKALALEGLRSEAGLGRGDDFGSQAGARNIIAAGGSTTGVHTGMRLTIPHTLKRCHMAHEPT